MMEASGGVTFKSDVHGIICFLYLKAIGGYKIYLHLCKVFGERNIMSKCAVYQWIEKLEC